LIDWVNSQRLTNPLTCLGDGHDGVWNLFKEIGTAPQRQEILDWYHLRENLYKVGGSLKRLKQAEAMLWQGQVDEAIALFADCRRQQAKNFCAYLDKHRRRIVNYEYFQAEQLSSIGSGAVESAVKQIDRRLKISGALRESRKYPSSVATALCLPQWFTRCLIFLQKWDAPSNGCCFQDKSIWDRTMDNNRDIPNLGNPQNVAF